MKISKEDKKLKYDREILYVQKLYFFLYLMSFFLCISLIVLWRIGVGPALALFALGLGLSYLTMIKRRSFSPPAKKISAQRIAKEISRNSNPLVISRFTSQLYFYFNETELAVSLLEKFIPTGDSLICATLGDILLRENQPKKALSIIRGNSQALLDPLLLFIQGQIYSQTQQMPEAVKMFERSLYFAKRGGFPHNGAHALTQFFLTLSYTASIHHALADCYSYMENFSAAKRHYWSGNLRLLDVTLWRYPQRPNDFSLKNYRKYQ